MNVRLLASGIALSALFAFAASQPAPAATPGLVGRPAATRPVDLLVKLQLRNVAELEELTRVQSDPASPQFRHFISLAQFRARYAPAPGTVQQAIAALRASGLQVTDVHSQLIHVSAPAASVERAFGVRLGLVRGAMGAVRLATDVAPTVPRTLSSLGATVVGLGERVEPRPQLQRVAKIPTNRYGPYGSYWFDDLKQAYSYPSYTPFNGKGVTIATVGYSDYSTSDAQLYFNNEKLGGPGALAPQPTLAKVLLPGYQPFDPNTGTSDEANIDVQQAGGSAPGAKIVGVAIPTTNGEGFLFGYSVILENNLADIVTTSYGDCELLETPAYNGGVDFSYILQAYHDIFLQGNALGVTFLFSSGDNAGKPCPQPGYFANPGTGVYDVVAGTSIWSSDPNATSVGGTNLQTSFVAGKLTSTYVKENANRDTVLAPFDLYGLGNGNSVRNVLWGSGGGPSAIFKKPWYQNYVNTGSNMRVDPDVSMQMGGCPFYAYPDNSRVPIRCGREDSAGVGVIAGGAYGFIGTSLSSPEFAGLLAVLEQAQGGVRFGNVNGYIYHLAQTNAVLGHPVFHQGIPGNNGVFAWPQGKLGYNAIVGVGTPIANNFLLLPYAPLAGDPQTPSNP